jgi:fermentation-respiration switch protein FrsA (DUF1100 family)
VKIRPALQLAPSRPRLRLRAWKRSRRHVRRAVGLTALLAGLLVAVYGGIILYMLSIENKLVFFPTRPDEEWLDKPDPSIQDITLHSNDGSLHGWYCQPEKPDAVFLICHGNAGNLSVRGKAMLDYRQRFNAGMLIFDYPGYGLSDGCPSEQGCYDAADAAYDWLIREKGFKPEQIIVSGESLGGGVAVDIASRRPCGALILVNTFANLPDVAQRLYQWLPVTLLMSNRFDSEQKIDRVRSPIFVTHGNSDEIIPYAYSQRLYDKAVAAKEYMLRDGKGHFDQLQPAELDHLARFLADHGALPKR